MRIVLILVAFLLSGCSHGFELHSEQEVTPQQMLDRADLVFVGVIEGHHFDSYPFFDVAVPPGNGTDLWRPLRRQVRVETVLRGAYTKPKIDVYEVFWTGGTTGDWNATRDGERYLFLVHKEAGRWRIVRDWWRSIFEVSTGYHSRLPLDESRPFWERYALMGFWIGPDVSGSSRMVDYRNDPGSALGKWRRTKLLLGLLRHPQPTVRIAACIALDPFRHPCEQIFSTAEWERVYEGGLRRREPFHWEVKDQQAERERFKRALYAQSVSPSDPDYSPGAMDELRVLTTTHDPVLRREFCATFMKRFPGDTDNGCPADKSIPATIVTEEGDVPLIGDWPTK